MGKKRSKISDAVIDNMLSWHNSGFNIFCSRPNEPDDQTGWKGWPNTLSGPRFIKERMVYFPSSEAADGLARVIHQAKDGNSSKPFLAKLILK